MTKFSIVLAALAASFTAIVPVSAQDASPENPAIAHAELDLDHPVVKASQGRVAVELRNVKKGRADPVPVAIVTVREVAISVWRSRWARNIARTR